MFRKGVWWVGKICITDYLIVDGVTEEWKHSLDLKDRDLHIVYNIDVLRLVRVENALRNIFHD